jgi:hypothetical protein
MARQKPDKTTLLPKALLEKIAEQGIIVFSTFIVMANLRNRKFIRCSDALAKKAKVETGKTQSC